MKIYQTMEEGGWLRTDASRCTSLFIKCLRLILDLQPPHQILQEKEPKHRTSVNSRAAAGALFPNERQSQSSLLRAAESFSHASVQD